MEKCSSSRRARRVGPTWGVRLTWPAAFAALAVLAAGACGGTAFSNRIPDAGSIDAALVDAAPDASADADLPADGPLFDVDAGVPFCANAGAHSFCEDFDTAGVPGKFTTVTSSSIAIGNGSKIVSDTSTFVSAPNSALAQTPALLRQNGDQATALLAATINAASTSPSTRLSWRADLQVGPGCVANADGAFVALITAGAYGLAIEVLPTQTALIELRFGNDGGVTASAPPQKFPAIPTEPRWVNVGIDLDLRLKTATVTVDGTAVLDTVMLTQSPPSSTASASILVGAQVNDTQGVSAGCRVHVDDVLFDLL